MRQAKQLKPPPSAHPFPPRYVLKARYDAHALYRNGRLHGIAVTLFSTFNNRVAVEYTPAQQPDGARVYHEIPAGLIDIQIPGIA